MNRMDRIKTKKREKNATKAREKHEKTSNCIESIHHRTRDISLTTL